MFLHQGSATCKLIMFTYRFGELFKVRAKWTFDEIQPYLRLVFNWRCGDVLHRGMLVKNLANSLSYQLNVFTLYFLLFRDLVAPGLSLNALLMKYSRSSMDASGVKIYNSKKPLWANSIAVLWLELEAFLTCRNDHSFNVSLKYFRRYFTQWKLRH